ncbi:hypothetical protein C8R43DRAFT_943902 [Mycena crocata]|nr:hypothetical protein C8R43DRAFT_943902 [Mycena crocata]
MVDVQAHTARLISMFVSCVLYGVSYRCKMKPRHEIKFPILAASILMLLVSTFSIGMSLQNVISAFVDYDGPEGCGASHSRRRASIYRCYVIYDRSWSAIAAPGASWIALSVLPLASASFEANLGPDETLNDANIRPLISATLLLTFATSLITTSLIVWRLITVGDPTDIQQRPHFLARIVSIFLETGLIYTLRRSECICWAAISNMLRLSHSNGENSQSPATSCLSELGR